MIHRRRRFRLPRRRRWYWYAGAVALALVLFVSFFRPPDAEDDEPPDTGAAAATATAIATGTAIATTTTAETPAVELPPLAVDPSRLERAEVVDVIDGDTIDVRVGGREERVRYYGVDTTERGEDCYREARERNEALAGTEVRLLPDARERDRFGRLLRYVFTVDGESIDARLIAEGLGYAWREDGAYREQLLAAEAAAESAGVGCLW